MENSTLSTKRSHIARYAFATLLAASSMLVAPIASADKKVFPATICQIWGGQSHLAEFISYSQFGKISNTHQTQRIGIVCPIMRDRPDRRMDLRIYWEDNFVGSGASSVGVLACRLRSNSVWGASPSIASVAFNSVTNPGNPNCNNGKCGTWAWQNLLGQTSEKVYETSTYTLFCRLPPVSNGVQSSIGSIVTLED